MGKTSFQELFAMMAIKKAELEEMVRCQESFEDVEREEGELSCVEDLIGMCEDFAFRCDEVLQERCPGYVGRKHMMGQK